VGVIAPTFALYKEDNMGLAKRTKQPFRKRLASYIYRKLDPPPPVKGPSTVLLSGKILVKDNFLSEGDFIALQRWAFRQETPLDTKEREWGEELVRDFGPNMSSRQWSTEHEDMPEEPRKFVERLLEAGIIRDQDVIHLGVYRWQARSGMGMHSDSHTDTAITFYLNDVWHPEWGGDFTYYESRDDVDEGIGHTASPRRNRLVVNHSTVPHKVNYCSETAQDRVTLQAFVYKGAVSTD
jgi:hypothetical protein